jgi:hypothetical protein
MSLDLETQYRLAKVQPEFRNRVEAASVSVAITEFAAPPITGSGQVQRVTLANRILIDSTFAVDVCAWVVVSRGSVNAEADLTDQFIVTTLTASFDKIAQQVITLPTGGP